ncbi:MAG: hypothetical protein WBI14_06120 [Anaerolineaceae bacterium]
MLSGKFENCYGIKELDLRIDFLPDCSKAIIYAPNGVMKTSLAKVFEDIAKGKPSKDRIFECVTSYSIKHREKEYNFDSTTPNSGIEKSDFIYVINTFTDNFEFTNAAVGPLLADAETRAEYDRVTAEFNGQLTQIKKRLSKETGIPQDLLEKTIKNDFGLPLATDWTDIFETIRESRQNLQIYDFWNAIRYSDIFNDKVIAVYSSPEFQSSINAYIESLNNILQTSSVLTSEFTDRSAEDLGKSLKNNDIFKASHTIHLRDGCTIISDISDWNALVKKEVEKIYQEPKLKAEFEKLGNLLKKNVEHNRLRDLLCNHQEIVPLLRDIQALKINAWVYLFTHLDLTFEEYATNILEYAEEVKGLYQKASTQSERWKEVVDEFNRRFRVPFTIQIENKANVSLRDETAHISFHYSSDERKKDALTKTELMDSLSTGEKRALYLLYILFDLEKLRQEAPQGNDYYLIIADDVADSFDYKNKYAIIEYLNDLSTTKNIDLLILTHNFDFFRTVFSRLGVYRQNRLIAQRNDDGRIQISTFKYGDDFFKKNIVEKFNNKKSCEDEKKKLLISSITFYRNLCEYYEVKEDAEIYEKLTSFLHIKSNPITTESATIETLVRTLEPFTNSLSVENSNENYLTSVHRIAANICSINIEEVDLVNKIVVTIATRLGAESFLRKVLIANQGNCPDQTSNQTRNWFDTSKPFLTKEQIRIIDEVNLFTPECIHLNSFMYEPLIDLSDWTLKKLYNDVITKLTNNVS